MLMHPDKAFEIIMDSYINILPEDVNVIDSIGRVLYQDILSTLDIPPFNKSAMDGFAFNSQDNSKEFKIVETIAAGDIPVNNINIGECAKIMTGAMLPEGADKVIRVEFTTENNNIVNFNQEETSINICYRGENIKVGDKILDKGTLIRYQEIATLSSLGLEKVTVSRQPVVGLFTTGSELLNPGEEYQTGKIYNSNGPQLYNQITSIPCPCNYYGTVKDDKELISNMLERALKENDFILISGGVSMGDFDYIPEILLDHNVDLRFKELSIKPGKPTVFGIKDNKFIFGLPGNPVSTFVIFEIFVKSLIYRFMGHEYKPLWHRVVVNKTITRKNAERVEYRPVIYDGQYINPVIYHGSAHISALCKTNGFIRLEQGQTELKKGSEALVRQIW